MRQPRRGGSRIEQAGEQRLARYESLRALAALGVLVAHAWGVHHAFGAGFYASFPRRIIAGGGYGVYVFFALSGYLLFRPLARAAFGAGERVDLVGYARNRALRILPLYYAVVVVLFALREPGAHAGDWWRYATMTQNLFSASVLEIDGPIWSLIVEVQFYALLPVIAIVLGRVTRRDVRAAAAVLVAVGLAGFALRHALLHHDGTDPRVVYSLAATSFFFVPGMLLALAAVAAEQGRTIRLPGPLGSSDAWAIAAVAVWLVIFERWNIAPLAAVASFLTLGALALPVRPGRFAALLDTRALAVIGVASYSLYLWHLPLENSVARHISTSLPAQFGLAVPASLLIAWLSYRAIETPFLRLRRRWAKTEAPSPTPRELSPQPSAP